MNRDELREWIERRFAGASDHRQGALAFGGRRRRVKPFDALHLGMTHTRGSAGVSEVLLSPCRPHPARATDQKRLGPYFAFVEERADGVARTVGDLLRNAGLDPAGAPIYARALIGMTQSVADWRLRTKRIPRGNLVDYLLALAWRGFDGLPAIRRSGISRAKPDRKRPTSRRYLRQ